MGWKMGPFLKMAVWSVVVMALMPFGNVRAEPCVNPEEHKFANGTCAAPNLAQGTPNVHWLTIYDTDPNNKKEFTFRGTAAGYTVTLQSLVATTGGAVLDLSEYRADTLKVRVGPQSSTKVFVRVTENGKLAQDGEYIPTGMIPAERQRTFKAKVGGAPNFGAWSVAVVNYDSAPFDFFPGDIDVLLSCESGDDFVGTGTEIRTCLPSTPPPPPCPDGQRRQTPTGNCLPLTIVFENKNLALVGSPDSKVSIYGTDDAPLDKWEAVAFKWTWWRSDRLSVSITSEVGADIWYIIYENGQFVAEFNANTVVGSPQEFAASGSGYGKGLWRAVIVNWGSGTQGFGLTGTEFRFYCLFGSNFEMNPYTNNDQTCMDPQCPDDKIVKNNACEYNPCADPKQHRLADGTCIAPNLAENAPGVHWLTYADNVSGAKEVNLIGSGNSMSLTYAVGGAVLDLSKYHADTLKVSIPGQPSSKVFVRVTNNGVLVAGGEYIPAWTSTFTYSGGGSPQWAVAVVNYDPDGAQTISPDMIEVSLSCASGYDFSGTDIRTCLVEPPPPCPGGQRRQTPTGNCSLPDVKQEITNPTVSSGGGISLNVDFWLVDDLALGSGKAIVFEWKEYRANIFNLQVSAPSASFGSDIWFAVYENGLFLGEYKPASDLANIGSASMYARASSSGYGRGLWRLVITNWGSGEQSVQFGTSAPIRLNCDPMAPFPLNPLTQIDKTCLTPMCPDGKIPNASGNACVADTPPPPSATTDTPPPPPPSATTCAYTSAVGFNVWSRWNVFTLAGVELDGGSIEGRIAAVGTVQALNSAQVHTKQEVFISTKENAANGGPWSITANGAVTLTSSGGTTTVLKTVLNGGVESQSTITKIGVVVAGDKEAPNLSKLSADVDAAATYFTARSEAWNGLALSYIDANVSASEIRVQLHGKVNVVQDALSLTTASLAGIEKITLTGHPLGTLIINVAGAGKAVLSPKLKVTYKGRGASSPEPLTFGRVVLNFNAATELELSQSTSGASDQIDASILAPKAAAVFQSGAPKMRGNVVALSVSATNADLAVLPFGTRVASGGQNAPKRPFTSHGKRATACLWHTL